MPKLTDMQICAWIKAEERFEGRSDGGGLYLRYREADRVPSWRFRYKLAGKSRAMLIGSYAELSLSKARETAKELVARVALGYDVEDEKQERKAEALAKWKRKKTPGASQSLPLSVSNVRSFHAGNIQTYCAAVSTKILILPLVI